MANDDDKVSGGGAKDVARATGKPNDRPFDMWLHKQLHAMYDEIASEPLPDDLLKLIDKDAADADSKKKSAPE